MAKMSDMREEADVNYYWDEFKFVLDAIKSTQIIVLVEAEANCLFFKNLLDKQTCKFFATNGFENLLFILEKYKTDAKILVLGIIDADFRRINGNITVLENLFMTDYHDTEIMMSFSGAWKKLLNKYSQETKLENFEKQNQTNLRDFLLKTLKKLSLIRLINEKQKLELKFKSSIKGGFKYIDYDDFVNSNTLEIDLDKLLKTIENKSQKTGFLTQNIQFKADLQGLLEQNFDLKELSNGHDLMNILALSLSKAIGNYASSSKISASQLENDLILAYHFTDFQQTNLYADLKEWQTKNNFLVLKTI
jgi:hypothetical protein